MEPQQNETFIGRARRAQLVECAIEVIAELGYAQASVRKIADRAGVGLSVVMHHVGHKDDLVAAVVQQCYRSVLETMVPAVTAETTAQAKLAAHIRTHLAYLDSHRSHQLALNEIANGYRSADGRRLQELDIDPESAEALHEVGLESIFRLGTESGEFRTLSPESMATAVRGAIGAAMMQILVDPTFDLAEYGDQLVEAFVRASIAAQTDRAQPAP